MVCDILFWRGGWGLRNVSGERKSGQSPFFRRVQGTIDSTGRDAGNRPRTRGSGKKVTVTNGTAVGFGARTACADAVGLLREQPRLSACLTTPARLLLSLAFLGR